MINCTHQYANPAEEHVHTKFIGKVSTQEAVYLAH